MENSKDRYSDFFVMLFQRSRLLIIIIFLFLSFRWGRITCQQLNCVERARHNYRKLQTPTKQNFKVLSELFIRAILNFRGTNEKRFSLIVFFKEENKLWKLSREDKNHTMMGKKTNRMGKKKQIEASFSFLFFQLSRFRRHPL